MCFVSCAGNCIGDREGGKARPLKEAFLLNCLQRWVLESPTLQKFVVIYFCFLNMYSLLYLIL